MEIFKDKYNIEDIFNNKIISSQNINIYSNKDELITMQSNNKKWYIKVLERLIKFFSKKKMKHNRDIFFYNHIY